MQWGLAVPFTLQIRKLRPQRGGMICPRVHNAYWILSVFSCIPSYHLHFVQGSVFQESRCKCWVAGQHFSVLFPFMPMLCREFVENEPKGKKVLDNSTGRKLPNWESLGTWWLGKSVGGGAGWRTRPAARAPVQLPGISSWACGDSGRLLPTCFYATREPQVSDEHLFIFK